MNLQKYTEKAQEAVLTARQLAEEASHSQIEPVHLLAALAEQPDGVVPQLLSRLGVDIGRSVAARDAPKWRNCRRSMAEHAGLPFRCAERRWQESRKHGRPA